MPENRILILNENQIKALKELWFVYGNHGVKHTFGNHKFIQGLIEDQKDYRSFYKKKNIPKESRLTKECINTVDEILNK